MDKNPEVITQENVKRTYKIYAPIYNFLFGRVLEPGRKALVAEVHLLKPNTILEIGVGTGLLLSKYPKNSVITGIDISEEMLAIAEKAASKLPLKIKLLHMNAEQLLFADASFDCVVLPYVLSVTPNPGQLIAEARRVCKKDGYILIVNHFSGSGYWWFLEKAMNRFARKIGFRSEFSYQEQIETYDWKVIKLKTVNLLGLSKLVLIKNYQPSN